nr:hypothetical protein [Tanacetum cinerariifolium]
MMMMRRRSTQLRPTLFHLHLHSLSRIGYLSDPSRRHSSPLILPIPLLAASPPLQLLSFDRRADRPEVTLPPRKRLSIVHCPRYEAEESSVAAAARPIKGIRDTWIDPRDVAEEEALTTLEGVNTRVTKLAAVQEQDTQDIYRVMEDTQATLVGNKMHKAFPLPGESSHWQYKFPLPVEGVPTTRRMEIPLPGVCTAMMKKLPGLKAELQDIGIAISELKKLKEKLKGKYVDTKFEKSSVIRQLNDFKSQRPSILGKPTIFLDSLKRKDI